MTEEELYAQLENMKAADQIIDYEIIGRCDETGDLLYTVKEYPALDRIVLTKKGRMLVEKYMAGKS